MMTQQYDPRDEFASEPLEWADTHQHDDPRVECPPVSGWLEGPDGVEPVPAPAAPAPPQRPVAHTIDIGLRNGETGHVVLDGVDIGTCVVGAVLYLSPGRGPHVVLELLPGETALHSDVAHVEVGGLTRDVLTRLGWTPPAAPKVPVATEGNGVQD
jgi:hypothetical protein